jgi:hypothetical protein
VCVKAFLYTANSLIAFLNQKTDLWVIFFNSYLLFIKDIFLETLNENKPAKRKDNSEDFLTRCILKLKPLDGQEAEKNLMFTIVHPLIIDARVDEQTRAFADGKAAVAERVKLLKERLQQQNV